MKSKSWVPALVVTAVFALAPITGCDDTETGNLDVAGPSEYTIQMSMTPNPLRVGDSGTLTIQVFRNAAPYTGATVNLTASDPGVSVDSVVFTDATGRADATVSAGTTTSSSAVTIVASVDSQTSSLVLTISRPITTISLSVNPDPLVRGGTAIGTVEVLQDGVNPSSITITVHITEGFIVDFESPDELLVGIQFEDQTDGRLTFGIEMPAGVTENFTTFSISAGGFTQDFIVNITD